MGIFWQITIEIVLYLLDSWDEEQTEGLHILLDNTEVKFI